MNNTKTIIFLCLLGCISYLPFLGGVHLFDWDEINFAEISREMILLSDYLRVHINFEPFWEKPPFFCWLQVVAMKLLGINEYASRLPNAIAGILTLVTLYKFGSYYKSEKFGLIWALSYWGSILPFLYFKSGIIDPWFNFFIFTSLYYFYKYLRARDEDIHDNHSLLWSGLLLGLGVLTKGPVAYLLYGLTILVYYIVHKFRHFPNISQLFILLFSSLLFSCVWLGIETYQNGTWFINTFTEYQIRLLTTHDAGHQGFPGYHVIVLLIGCFPASLFALLPAWKNFRDQSNHEHMLFRLMLILLIVVVVVFSLVQSKIVHYSSLAYFPVTFLAACGIYALLKQEVKIPDFIIYGVLLLGLLFAVITGALPFIGSNVELLFPLLEKDPFGLASLAAEVDWSWWRAFPAVIIMSTIIGFILLRKLSIESRLGILFAGTIVFVYSILFLQLNNIEAYTQRALIEFCKEHADEDAYIKFIGTKSYAPLFYGKKQPDEDPRSNDQDWLLTSAKLNKDVYFIVKVQNQLDLIKYDKISELYRKNGFIFYQRKVHN